MENITTYKELKQMETNQVTIDEIDAKILRTLIKDARTRFTDIAKDCGISTNAIVKRFYKLKQLGVIKGTSIRLNMKKFGYKFFLSIQLNIDSDKLPHILDWLKKIPNILSCYQVVGKYDVHAAILTKSLEDIHHIKQEAKKQKGVNQVRIAASLDEYVCFPENLEIQSLEPKKSG